MQAGNYSVNNVYQKLITGAKTYCQAFQYITVPKVPYKIKVGNLTSTDKRE